MGAVCEECDNSGRFVRGKRVDALFDVWDYESCPVGRRTRNDLNLARYEGAEWSLDGRLG